MRPVSTAARLFSWTTLGSHTLRRTWNVQHLAGLSNATATRCPRAAEFGAKQHARRQVQRTTEASAVRGR